MPPVNNERRFPKAAKLVYADPQPFCASYEDFTNPGYWNKLVQNQLNVTTGAADSKVDCVLSASDVERVKKTVDDDGVCLVHADELSWKTTGVNFAKLSQAIVTLTQKGWPASFIIMYDEIWKVVSHVDAVMKAATGNSCNMDILAWLIDPNQGHVGFSPHRDRQPEDAPSSFRSDGSAKYTTAWIPFTDACPDNSCLYMLPRWADPGYFKGDAEDGPDPLPLALSTKESYQSIRAYPAEAGAAVIFTHRILHWGSKGRVGYHTPRINVSFGCADDTFEPSYLDRSKHMPLPTIQVRAALACAQLIVYHERFDLTPKQLALFKRVFQACASEFHPTYRAKVLKEFVAATQDTTARSQQAAQAQADGGGGHSSKASDTLQVKPAQDAHAAIKNRAADEQVTATAATATPTPTTATAIAITPEVHVAKSGKKSGKATNDANTAKQQQQPQAQAEEQQDVTPAAASNKKQHVATQATSPITAAGTAIRTATTDVQDSARPGGKAPIAEVKAVTVKKKWKVQAVSLGVPLVGPDGGPLPKDAVRKLIEEKLIAAAAVAVQTPAANVEAAATPAAPVTSTVTGQKRKRGGTDTAKDTQQQSAPSLAVDTVDSPADDSKKSKKKQKKDHSTAQAPATAATAPMATATAATTPATTPAGAAKSTTPADMTAKRAATKDTKKADTIQLLSPVADPTPTQAQQQESSQVETSQADDGTQQKKQKKVKQNKVKQEENVAAGVTAGADVAAPQQEQVIQTPASGKKGQQQQQETVKGKVENEEAKNQDQKKPKDKKNKNDKKARKKEEQPMFIFGSAGNNGDDVDLIDDALDAMLESKMLGIDGDDFDDDFDPDMAEGFGGGMKDDYDEQDGFDDDEDVTLDELIANPEAHADKIKALEHLGFGTTPIKQQHNSPAGASNGQKKRSRNKSQREHARRMQAQQQSPASAGNTPGNASGNNGQNKAQNSDKPQSAKPPGSAQNKRETRAQVHSKAMATDTPQGAPAATGGGGEPQQPGTNRKRKNRSSTGNTPQQTATSGAAAVAADTPGNAVAVSQSNNQVQPGNPVSGERSRKRGKRGTPGQAAAAAATPAAQGKTPQQNSNNATPGDAAAPTQAAVDTSHVQGHPADQAAGGKNKRRRSRGASSQGQQQQQEEVGGSAAAQGGGVQQPTPPFAVSSPVAEPAKKKARKGA